jgi:uncharacterized protein YggE
MRSRLAALLALAVFPAVTRAQVFVSSADTNRTLVFAAGQARQSVTPDRATVIILIDAQAMSVDEASTRLASIERGVLDTLRRFNLGSGVQAFSGGVVPFRQQGMSSSMAVGPSFSGRSTIRVELARLDQLSAITSAALAKGATFIAPPTFTASNADDVRRTLLPRAFEIAQHDAEALARAAGGRLGRMVEVTEQSAPTFVNQSEAIIYSSSMFYDNGPRPTPNTTVIANVSARWVLVRGAP